MSGLGLRRAVGTVAALSWPACRLFETITHPPWGTRLSDALAPLVGCVMLALVLTSPAAHRRSAARGPRHARSSGLLMELVLFHVHSLSARMDRCEARQERAEAQQERGEKRLGHVLQLVNETNEEAGYCAPDHNETMPRGLRVIRLRTRLA